MNDYAKATGRARTVAPVALAPREARSLSESEVDLVAKNRAFVIEHIPEIVPLIKALHAEGLIDGWRAVQNCKLDPK